MKTKLLSFSLIGISCFIIWTGCNQQEKGRPTGIHFLPRYGHIQKNKQQLEADTLFLQEMDEMYPDRRHAATAMLESGWMYFHKGNYNRAMARTNQAWLLDSTDIGIYAIFTCILDITLKTDEAIEMLDQTLEKICIRENLSISDTIPDLTTTELMYFITGNAKGVYIDTQNTALIKHLYARIDDLPLSEPDKTQLKSDLEESVPEINHRKKR